MATKKHPSRGYSLLVLISQMSRRKQYGCSDVMMQPRIKPSISVSGHRPRVHYTHNIQYISNNMLILMNTSLMSINQSIKFISKTKCEQGNNHSGHVDKISVSGYRDHWFKPLLHQYVGFCTTLKCKEN